MEKSKVVSIEIENTKAHTVWRTNEIKVCQGWCKPIDNEKINELGGIKVESEYTAHAGYFQTYSFPQTIIFTVFASGSYKIESEQEFYERNLKDIIDSITNSDGVYESYVDYRDEFDSDTLITMRERFLEGGYLDDMDYFNWDSTIDGLYEYITSEMNSRFGSEWENHIELNDYMPDIPIDYGLERILKQSTVRCVVRLGEGEPYQDIVRYLREDVKSIRNRNDFEFPYEIIELIKSQGYTLPQAYKYLRYNMERREIKHDKFLHSILRELDNSYGYNELTILIEMNGYDYVFNKAESITVQPDCTIGFVDYINGGGSILEIELNNEITIDLTQEDNTLQAEDSLIYSITSIYGLVGECWQGTYIFNE